MAFAHAGADASFGGFYTYGMEAFKPPSNSGQTVQIHIHTETDQDKPIILILKDETVRRIWSDFAPYRRAQE